MTEFTRVVSDGNSKVLWYIVRNCRHNTNPTPLKTQEIKNNLRMDQSQDISSVKLFPWRWSQQRGLWNSQWHFKCWLTGNVQLHMRVWQRNCGIVSFTQGSFRPFISTGESSLPAVQGRSQAAQTMKSCFLIGKTIECKFCFLQMDSISKEACFHQRIIII